MKKSNEARKINEFHKKAVSLKLHKTKYILLICQNLIISKRLQQKYSYAKEIPLHYIFDILFNQKGW